MPTFAELGITNYEWPGWTGIGAPAGTPREIITRWHAEAVKAMNTPEIEKIIDQMSSVPAASTPEQMAQTIAREIALWGPVTKTLGIKPE